MGYEHDGLYYFQREINPSMGTAAIISEFLPLQWNFRLGHASLKAISCFHY